MNEAMKQAWLEISQMLGEPTREELDVFLRTWQRASQATRKALAEQPAQRTWVGLSDLNIDELENEYMKSAQTAHEFLRAIEAKLKEKNNG